MSKIKTYDWDAWIDEMPSPGTPNSNPTMHVIGMVDTFDKQLAFLRKKIPQGTNPHILLLDLHTTNGTVPVNQPQRVHYQEFLGKNIYKSVSIFYNGVLEAEIPEVKIIK